MIRRNSRSSAIGGITLGLAVPIALVLAAWTMNEPAHHRHGVASDSRGAPDVRFDPTVTNFQAVLQGEVLRCSFILRNESTNECRIIALETSCACATVSEGVLGVVLKPQGSIIVPAVVDTKDKSGQSDSTLVAVVESADGNTLYRATAVIRSEIVPDFSFAPPFADFGEVVPGLRYTNRIIFTPKQFSSLALQLNGEGDQSSPFEVSISGSSASSSSNITVSVILATPLVESRSDMTRFLRFKTSSARSPEVLIKASAIIVPDVEVQPSIIVLSAKADTNGTVRLDLRSRDPSVVRSVSAVRSDICVPIAEEHVEKEHLGSANNRHLLSVKKGAILGASAIQVGIAPVGATDLSQIKLVHVRIRNL